MGGVLGAVREALRYYVTYYGERCVTSARCDPFPSALEGFLGLWVVVYGVCGVCGVCAVCAVCSGVPVRRAPFES